MGPRRFPLRGLVLAAALAAAAPAWAAGLSEAQVRAFLAAQQRAWNAGALADYYAGFVPTAAFTDQYRTPSGQVVPYGTSTLGEAEAQSRRFRASSKVAETGEAVRISLGADGRSAEVVSHVVSRIHGPKGLRVTCAERRQDLVLAGGQLRSKGQTDTFSRCPK